MNKRNYDRDMMEKMYDIIELIYILKRLTDDFYEDDRSKKYLLEMMNDMQNVKYSIDKYKGTGIKRNASKFDYRHYGTSDTFIDKIIFYLKSLNEG